MALMPKRVKFRKSQRGRIKGDATRGNRVVFGDYALQASQGGWLSAQTIEAGRVAAQQYMRTEGRLYVRVFQMPAAAGTGHFLLISLGVIIVASLLTGWLLNSFGPERLHLEMHQPDR